MVALRAYQTAAVDAAERDLANATIRSTLLNMATGVGKTICAGTLAQHWVGRHKRVLFLTNRFELVNQTVAAFEELGLQVGREQGARWSKSEPVVVASVQTMRGGRLASFTQDAFDLIIVDEAHHAPATSYRDILEHFPNAKVVGVTASTDRADGIALGTVFDHCAFRYDIGQAVAEGFLTPVYAVRVEVEGMDLSKVRSKTIRARYQKAEHTDLHPKDLGAAVIEPSAVEGVVTPLLELAGHRRTVVFAVNRAHAAAIATSINARSVGGAKVIHGGMPKRLRRSVLEGHRAGRFQFLVNVMLLTEGYDDPAIACVAMARPTQSRILYTQACGRGLRLAEGKRDCLIIDFVGVSCEYSLIGPDDVLAGALLEPTVRRTADRAGRYTPLAVEAYKPAKWHARFKTSVVKVLRDFGKQTRRAGSFLGRLWKNLVG